MQSPGSTLRPPRAGAPVDAGLQGAAELVKGLFARLASRPLAPRTAAIPAPPAERARARATWAALVLGLAVIYAPALRSVALFNDDYVNLVEAPSASWIVGGDGRPVQYLVMLAGHHLLQASGGNPLALRLVGFALCVGLAAALVLALRRGLGAWGAVALVLFACSIPAYLVTFGWLSLVANVPGFLAAAGAYATGYLLLGEARTTAARVGLGLATVALVAIATLTYQVAAGLPVALVGYHLLFERDRGAPSRRTLVAYALFAAGLLAALVALKVVLALTGISLADRAEQTLSRLASVRGLLTPLRIFDENFALHYYWWGWLTREVTVALGLGLTALVLRVAWRETRPAVPAAADSRARWLLVLAGVGGAGMLFALDGSRELRSKPFLTLLLLLLVVYALRETRLWARLPGRPVAVAVVVGLTMWSGRSTLADGLVTYAERELAAVQAILARADAGRLERVHVLQPENHCFARPCYGWFEFNMKLASSQEWVPRGLVRYALTRLGRGGERANVTFSHAERAPDGTTLVVDLRPLERSLRAEQGEVVDLMQLVKRDDVAVGDVTGLSGLWLRLRPPPGAVHDPPVAAPALAEGPQAVPVVDEVRALVE